MGDERLTACEMMNREEIRQNYLRENIKIMFSELSPQNQFMILDELTRDENILKVKQKNIKLRFDAMIEPCPYCGSHDMYFKVKQLYRDMTRYRLNQKYGIPEIEHFKEPWTASGTFMCGRCKAKFRANAYTVPELYEQWNKYATDNRRW